jgi:hypothetical protein
MLESTSFVTAQVLSSLKRKLPLISKEVKYAFLTFQALKRLSSQLQAKIKIVQPTLLVLITKIIKPNKTSFQTPVAPPTA